jgi:hypothetical protein
MNTSISPFSIVCISYKAATTQFPTPKPANRASTLGESIDAQEHQILFRKGVAIFEHLVANFE